MTPREDDPVTENTDAGRTNTDSNESAADDEMRADGDAQTMSLEEQLQAALADRDAYIEKWTRTQAELENYRKRVQREMEQNRRYQAMPLLRDLVGGLDNLNRAIEAADTSKDIQGLLEGVKLVAKQFQDTLSAHSAVPIDAMGKPFDPNLHEAVQQVPTNEYPPMTVVGEVQRGWTLHDRVVRPSVVLVSVAPDKSTSNSSP